MAVVTQAGLPDWVLIRSRTCLPAAAEAATAASRKVQSKVPAVGCRALQSCRRLIPSTSGLAKTTSQGWTPLSVKEKTPRGTAVEVGVTVAVGVGVNDAVGVGVNVAVAVGVNVAVAVGVNVAVAVGVNVTVGVGVNVAVAVGVRVAVGVGVAVGVWCLGGESGA